MSRDPIRLVVVDDHQIVIDGLKAMLSRHAGEVEIVGEATDRDTALRVIGDTDPDVVLLDVRLRGESGLDLCAELLGREPDRRVVFLTVYDDEQYLFQALRLGAAGFLLKRVQGAELVAHLRQVLEGIIVIDSMLAGRVAQSAARLHAGVYWPGAHLGLTQRESEVLSLIVAGLSNRAIAQKLVVGDETIKSHVRGVYRKLEVSDRSQAVALALREGIFS